MSIWFAKFPLSPSVNDSLMPIPMKKMKKDGSTYMGAGFTSTAVMKQFKVLVQLYKNRHAEDLKPLKKQLKGWVDEGYVLQIDCFFVFHDDRVFSTPNKKVLRIDANNRLKGQLDAVSTVVGIDDSYFFSGNCEKVTSSKKEDECAIIKISPMKPRTIEQIKKMIYQPVSS